ncbi:histidine kinase [Chitinophaga horti]|uniref:Histidine kinase n=1 Tax=Chitinophaga horti TaxID=2920382 RepID=A0ABY6IX72_9BACT|nr:histidine kinase [Chitinophaga horti]UYQ91971.1 histidine kinase [Chitinophaga horti]
MMEHDTRAGKIILLAALAIALFVTLPRIVIAAYLKVTPAWGVTARGLCTFLVAWLCLWINVKSVTIPGINPAKITHRLALNVALLILIKVLFHLLNIPAPSEAYSRAQVFLFNVTLVLEICLCVLIAEMYRLLKNNQQQRLSNEMLLKANAEATFEVLKTQINPHFLFNSLNTINAMIDKDIDAAKKFVANMSEVYRYILNSAGKPVVTLDDELSFTASYTKMLLERHAGGLFIEINIPAAYTHFLLPPVSLQTLIENAVKHNVVSLNNPLIIRVAISRGQLEVTNKIHQRKKEYATSTGTGLYNLHQRYLHLCDTSIDISNNEDTFMVALPLLKFSNGRYVPNLANL